MDEKREKELKEKEKLYFAKDNTRRLFLFDMLRRKECLKNITLKDLEGLVHDINSLTANLEHDFREGKLKIEVHDKDNWSCSSLVRDIFLHNVLDIPINCDGTTKDFKEKLKKRWGKE